MANTKLSPTQKSDRKVMLAKAKAQGIQVLNLDDKTVMAYQEKGNTVEFSLSVMSPDEQKFRVKVGEYNALCRFEDCETVKMDVHDFSIMCEFCWDAYPF